MIEKAITRNWQSISANSHCELSSLSLADRSKIWKYHGTHSDADELATSGLFKPNPTLARPDISGLSRMFRDVNLGCGR